MKIDGNKVQQSILKLFRAQCRQNTVKTYIREFIKQPSIRAFIVYEGQDEWFIYADNSIEIFDKRLREYKNTNLLDNVSFTCRRISMETIYIGSIVNDIVSPFHAIVYNINISPCYDKLIGFDRDKLYINYLLFKIAHPYYLPISSDELAILSKFATGKHKWQRQHRPQLHPIIRDHNPNLVFLYDKKYIFDGDDGDYSTLISDIKKHPKYYYKIRKTVKFMYGLILEIYRRHDDKMLITIYRLPNLIISYYYKGAIKYKYASQNLYMKFKYADSILANTKFTPTIDIYLNRQQRQQSSVMSSRQRFYHKLFPYGPTYRLI